ncbi:ketopantoate reductase family protein [Snodgrassella sp. CFCC 13594]|uniref:ketopantoate reductase family protein n=1 Tax=Snodgrassella sp. CFCC 13594 TaxID=1775559 RepID=UPI0008323799|nr:ketopantoate reductase family protein [Snodgrassella sp. CFCC 13594]
MLNTIQHVYIIGLGAIGALYAAKLHDYRPESVHILADEARCHRYRAQGFWVNDARYDFDYVTPQEALTGPKADVILVCVKASQLLAAAQLCRGVLAQHTRILSLLNGISSEVILGEALGAEHLLLAYGVQMDALREGHAVHYSQPGFLVFGESNNHHISPDVARIQSWLSAAQIPHQTPTDMRRAQWHKFMLNVAVNQVSAVLRLSYGQIKHNLPAQRLMHDAAQEVLAISKHLNIGLTEADVDTILQPVMVLSDNGYTSMAQDVLAKRPTEIAIFGETVCHLGQQYGVPTPINAVLTTQIHALEQSFQAARSLPE